MSRVTESHKFIVKLLDIVVPDLSVAEIHKHEMLITTEEISSRGRAQSTTPSCRKKDQIDYWKCKGKRSASASGDMQSKFLSFHQVFLVTTHHEFDLAAVMKIHRTQSRITQQHVTIMMYNALISLTFLHSFGVVHRDIKATNMLVNTVSNVFLCDLGLARILPNYSHELEIELSADSLEQMRS